MRFFCSVVAVLPLLVAVRSWFSSFSYCLISEFACFTACRVCSILVLSSVSFCFSTLVPVVNPAVEAEKFACKVLSAIVPPEKRA